MKGYKTWIAAIGTMATGVARAAGGLGGDAIDPNEMYQGLLIFMAGLAMIGIGHKLEKNKT